ncbi:hypothetical protein, partial [Pseudomonas sp. AD21]|uniref:hypothetical protein n=1 Tax=Pseudomonas sp. AD21 TaxID=396378 RepID=UPI001C438A5F
HQCGDRAAGFAVSERAGAGEVAAESVSASSPAGQLPPSVGVSLLAIRFLRRIKINKDEKCSSQQKV